MIRLVIFDLDGTLVNAYAAVAESVNYTLSALGFPRRSALEIKRSVGKGDRMLMVHFVGEKLADKALGIYRPHHAKALQSKGMVKLLPGTLALLRFLKARRIKLAIASNRPTRFTRIILRELGLLPFFDVVLCADRAPRPKPHPEILWAVAAKLGIDRQEALYVGDMTIDVQCGRKAGMRVAAVATGSSAKKELKDLKPWVILDKIVRLKSIVTR